MPYVIETRPGFYLTPGLGEGVALSLARIWRSEAAAQDFAQDYETVRKIDFVLHVSTNQESDNIGQ